MKFWLVATLFSITMWLPINTGAALGEEGAPCSPTDVRLTTTPVQPQNIRALDYLVRAEGAVPSDPDVLLVGDSLLNYWKQADIDLAFGDRVVFNWALPGNRVQNLLWQLDNMSFGHINPKWIVLMVGVNNLNDQSAACAIAAGTKSAIEKLREAWPEARLVKVDVLPNGPGYIRLEDRRLSLNREVNDFLASDPKSFVLNIDNDMSCGRQHELSWLEINVPFVAQQFNCDNMTGDNTHLTQMGYSVLGPAIAQATDVQ